ncbi:hypothetical protein L3X38_002832 [Prunus dulcis]|uniref:R13L1/DRL21-like LRR repeat region domain-containing protein n=1 Tax=Prunus dulcis TaxID=3755 RepID=A0AAD4ZLC2_PRUDU|nr:hypothetical protein L3X38_002832 [Prunus dulcis]
MLPWFKALRVLKLCNENIEELPSSIGKLKHLRYLDISFTEIKRLPNSIGKLYNLQTLRATYCGLEEFPKDVQNLINLRYVYCDEGTKFPVGVLGRLTSLRKLPCSYEDYKVMGREIEELAVLNQLKGKLIICNLEHVRIGDEARKAKLKDKKNVCHFLFKWTKNRSTTNNNEEDVLEGLQPHSELERLEIRYFMGTEFPSWMIKLDNLKQIRLKGCNRCEKVPTLGHLPHLTVVWIQGCCGLQSIPDLNLFTSLRELSIESCDRLESLVVVVYNLNLFTSLLELSIESCDRLESLVSSGPINVELLNITSCSGLQSIPDLNLFTSLRKLSIAYCYRLESLVSSGPVNVVELLNITGCSSLQSIPDLNLFTSLRKLSIKSCDRLESLVSSGPVYVVELLNIIGCDGLQSIPDLNLFTSLYELSIESCDRLESLVSSGPINVELLNIIAMQRLIKLRALDIWQCPLLKERCTKDSGPEWPKISHIPHIDVYD